MIQRIMSNAPSRRVFLRSAPLAAAAGFSLVGKPFSAHAADAPEGFQVFTAQTLADDAKALADKPGNNNLVTDKNLLVVLTTETHKSAKEFEWHEGRDHVVQIVDGATLYELGGTPRNGRTTKPGEWLAAASEGSKSILLGKGDMLVIPRGTPHKRSTEDSVTFILISGQTAAAT